MARKGGPMTGQQRKVLELLTDAPEGLHPFQIADRLHLRTARHSVTKLIAAGLIEERPAYPGDTTCYITDLGREAIA